MKFFDNLKNKKLQHQADKAVALMRNFSCLCFSDTCEIIKTNNLEKVTAYTMKPESLVFFGHFIYAWANFNKFSEAFVIISKAMIIEEDLGGSQKIQVPRMENFLKEANNDFAQKKVTPKAIALWAGNGVAAQLLQDKKISQVNIECYTSGILGLENNNGIDWKTALEKMLIDKYKSF